MKLTPLAELERKFETLQQECAARQAALESMIDTILDCCNNVVEARSITDISAAAGALGQAIELSLESPQLKSFHHLSVVAAA